MSTVHPVREFLSLPTPAAASMYPVQGPNECALVTLVAVNDLRDSVVSERSLRPGIICMEAIHVTF